MKKLFIFFLCCLPFIACQAQDKRVVEEKVVGGPCEGCEAIYEYGNKELFPTDTLPEYASGGEKLKVTGTIYEADGKIPASDVILYIYHTNADGIYPTKGGETGWARRHGYLRGWIKTGKDGAYTFYTTRPGTYPSRSEPAHIHATIKEPGIKEYYINDFRFTDDPLLDRSKAEKQPRGGSGIVKPVKEKEGWVVKRDIILGLHIPNY